MAPPLNDGVHPSHHPAYGSRTGRFTIHLFNRSLHQLKLFHTLWIGYRFSWESVTQLMKINAPILISERIMFCPSPLVRPMQFSAPRFPWVLRLRLTSPLYQLVVMETSPGKNIFFPLIPAGSTTSVFISKETFRTSQWCACSSNLVASYPVPVRQYQGL